MLKTIKSLRELPYADYMAYLLKSEEDSKLYTNGYLFISSHPKMIIVFVDSDQKISKNDKE